jgi:type I restriction enzyme, R subunit
MTNPEAQARKEIDRQLEVSGGIVQDRDEANIYAGWGVSIQEFKLKPGHGCADYLLLVDGRAVGILETKKKGFPLGGVEVQAQKDSEGLPDTLEAPCMPLPFCYLSTGKVTKCTMAPSPKSKITNSIGH